MTTVILIVALVALIASLALLYLLGENYFKVAHRLAEMERNQQEYDAENKRLTAENQQLLAKARSTEVDHLRELLDAASDELNKAYLNLEMVLSENVWQPDSDEASEPLPTGDKQRVQENGSVQGPE